MSTKHTFSNWALWRAWIKSFEIKSNDIISCIAIILACLAVGLLTLRLPEHRAYHRATVRYVGVRHGSKRPGAQALVELPSGAQVFLQTRAFIPNLKEGAALCVQEMQDRIWGRTTYLNALPSRCLAN